MNTQKRNILIPTDFSEICQNAIEHGLMLAKNLNFGVKILHVVNKDTKSYLKQENLDMEGLEKKLKTCAEENKKEYKIDVDYVLEKGSIFDVISKVATNENASLIILGTHGKVGFQRLTGSYALKVISNTDVPTIVVQQKAASTGYNNIVFPVTVSTKDRQKISVTVSLARAFDAKIHIIPKFESDKNFKRKIMSVVKQMKNIFDEHGIDYVDKVSKEQGGNFAKQVIDYSVVNNADLIIIMTSSDQSLPMFDSWDEQIVFNSSQIPVICVNPAKVKKLNFGW